ncbi:MAG TPA: hypothetical protein VM146_11135 [Steroidobacteraceae bacterium]|nr:hypothetical protein [Steroidobacteraceae bacterium]
MSSIATDITTAVVAPIEDRRRLANRIYYGALAVTVALTFFVGLSYFTGIGRWFTGPITFDQRTLANVLLGALVLNVGLGFIWWGLKTLLLRYVVGFDRDERRAVFSSRMDQPFDVAALTARHSERRIRIVDMIGRRGRFMVLGLAGFFYLYSRVGSERPENFATAFLSDNLLDAVLTGWMFVLLYRGNHFLARAVYGPQSRVMDGVLARANCLLIMTLWGLFKFVLLPIGAQLTALYSPAQFAAVFALIWGSYMVCDTLAEVGGSIYGTMKIRVRGVGDVNRKSIAGTVTGFVGSLAFCMAIVGANGLPPSFYALALAVSISNTLLELYSPRGTDDFWMATGNALICWAFGAWMLS